MLSGDIPGIPFLIRMEMVNVIGLDSSERAIPASIGWMSVPNMKKTSANIVVEVTVEVEHAMQRLFPFSTKINPPPDMTGCCVVKYSFDEIGCRSECHRSFDCPNVIETEFHVKPPQEGDPLFCPQDDTFLSVLFQRGSRQLVDTDKCYQCLLDLSDAIACCQRFDVHTSKLRNKPQTLLDFEDIICKLV